MNFKALAEVKKRKCARIGALAMTGLICAATVFGAVRDTGASEFIDLSKEVSLQVNWGNPDYIDDLKGTEVEVDLYRIADAAEVSGYDTYSFAPTSDFTSYKDQMNSSDTDSDDWIDIAQSVAKDVLNNGKGGTPTTVAMDAAIGAPDVTPGLYLVVTRNEDAAKDDYVTTVKDDAGDENIATIVDTTLWEYTVTPQLVALPGKNTDDASRMAMTSDSGTWIYDMVVSQKADRTERYGDLKIVKTLKNFTTVGTTADTPTFVFEITGKDADGKVQYSNVASISFTASDEKQKSVTVEHIRAGLSMTVKEVYSGAEYELTTGDDEAKTIIADDTISFSFENSYDKSINRGTAVDNHFHKADGSDWSLVEKYSDGTTKEVGDK